MRTRWLLLALVAVASAAAGPSCKSSEKACTPGGDGAYVNEPYAKLADYCLLTLEDGRVVPKGDVVPYDVNVPLFSDYATKFRAIWVPPGKHAEYVEGKAIDFPVGTIVTKSFGFPSATQTSATKWIETRLLIRTDAGWRAVTYAWDDAQKEATIKPGGAVLDVTVPHPGGDKHASYLVPNQNQCKKCHAVGDDIALVGIRAEQLNKDFPYPSGVQNQLAMWTKMGILTGAPAQAPKLAAWDDPVAGSVETRARAYLDANCAYCHNPTGEARTSGLFLGFGEIDPYKLGACKTPVAAGKAAANLKYAIVPGKPDESILLYRMRATEPAIAMPEIGRSLVHEEAVALIRDWIAQMPGSCTP
jgi:uncharacterized repeat protein (TIGR03806 family)